MTSHLDDGALVTASFLGFSLMLRALANSHPDGTEIHREGVYAGSSFDRRVIDNPWMNGVVVLSTKNEMEVCRALEKLEPPPLCIWTSIATPLPGRTMSDEYEAPCMGLSLATFSVPTSIPTPSFTADVDQIPFKTVGDVNERAYDLVGGLVPLITPLQHPCITTYSITIDQKPVCVGLTFHTNTDVGIHFVATDPKYRRRGLATCLALDIIARAKRSGRQTVTLQASKEGFLLWSKLGFRQVGTLYGHISA